MPSSPHSSFGLRHSGFTFIEVLFATILLGIGFIMIAAVFPVAIQQTAAVSDETQSTALARDAIKKIQAIADAIPNYGLPVTAPATTVGQTNTFFQPTYRTTSGVNVPVVAAFSYGLTQALATDSYYSQDNRYGWVGFYRRDSYNSPFAQVYIIALENPNFPKYISPYYSGTSKLITGASLSQPISPPWTVVAPPIPGIPSVTYDYYNYGTSGFLSGSPTPPTGQAALAPTFSPRPFTNPSVPGGLTAGFSKVTLGIDASGNAYVAFQTLPQSAVTGAYLLIADDGTTPTGGTAPTPLLTGRFLKLGNVDTNLANAYYLQSGYDFTVNELHELYSINNSQASGSVDNSTATPPTASIAGIDFFLIGRAPNLNDPKFSYTGPNQDIGVATGFVRVNTANN